MPGEKTGDRKKLVLAAMIFAVAMTFIDQTIVSIAVPEIQRNLHLSTNGVQWVVNGYLLSLAAFFAFGGRLADMIGHSKMVVIGIVVFAVASTMCGLTPAGSGAEAWIVSFRVLQGLGGAIMYPAAVALVVGVFPVNERGRAMAIFFGVAGGLTAIGPILGGVLSQWTWRAIFWVNIPVAIVALILTAMAKPKSETRPAKLDVPGLVLVCSGVGLSVFGIQQTQLWGWGSATAIGAMVGGLALLVAFALVELRQRQPLISVRLFAIRAFLVENIVLVISMACFIPIFFFASVYAQEALGDGPNQAGLFLLLFFAGFAPGVQVGGRVLDRRGAKQVVVIGSAVAAVGFELWSRKVLGLSVGTQWYYIALAGFGMGLMVGPANTDAINQAGRLSYGEATGHHPDHEELRGQPGPGRARHPLVELHSHAAQPEPGEGRALAPSRGQGGGAGFAGTVRQWQGRVPPSGASGGRRRRLRDALGADGDGHHHGRLLRGRPLRAAARHPPRVGRSGRGGGRDGRRRRTELARGRRQQPSSQGCLPSAS